MKKRKEVVIEIGRQVVQIQVHLVFLPSTQDIRDFKQQRRWRLRKRHLKVNSRCLKLFRAYFISFNTSNVGKSGKEKESCCLVFPSSTKRENRHFHIVVLQQRLRNVQRRVVHVQSCCFSNLNLCRTRCRRLRLRLSSLLFRMVATLSWFHHCNAVLR